MRKSIGLFKGNETPAIKTGLWNNQRLNIGCYCRISLLLVPFNRPMNLIFHVGRYFMLIRSSIGKPDKWPQLWRSFLFEMENLGINSIGLVTIISLFMGAVITLQTASNIESALIPKYTVGFATRQSVILEFAPTIISLILAGKVGSNIASEIGTMRVTEQIDALDIMGVNAPVYLILPKMLGLMVILPFIVVLAMFLGIFGGWVVSIATGVISSQDYFYGITFDFDSFTITYALIKTIVFAMVITTISAYHGYYTKGGALEVGRSSTKAVVYASVMILVTNYLITQLILI